jgi:hypothetical protein
MWDPIETAPKDGDRVLAVCADAQYPRVNITWWADDGWRFMPQPDKFIAPGPAHWFPTHWMPLPAPPDVSST